MNEYQIVNVSTEEEFQKIVNANVPVLVDFWAAWCNPCKAMLPILNEVAQKHFKDIKFIKVNIETPDLQTVVSKYGIRSIPHLILFKRGSQLGSITGLQTANAIQSFLEHYLTIKN